MVSHAQYGKTEVNFLRSKSTLDDEAAVTISSAFIEVAAKRNNLTVWFKVSAGDGNFDLEVYELVRPTAIGSENPASHPNFVRLIETKLAISGVANAITPVKIHAGGVPIALRVVNATGASLVMNIYYMAHDYTLQDVV